MLSAGTDLGPFLRSPTRLSDREESHPRKAYGWLGRLTRCHRLGAFDLSTSRRFMFRMTVIQLGAIAVCGLV